MVLEDGEIVITPFEVVINKDTGYAEITLRNITKSDYAFKIKTTHPLNYKVKPSIGMLAGCKSQTIAIEMISTDKVLNLRSHMFLFQFIKSGHTLTAESLKQIFLLKGVKILEQRIGIRYSGPLVNEETEVLAPDKPELIFISAGVFIIYNALLLFRQLLFGI
ncbi:hypothetical protein NEIG_00117 [Nematocida sp. ERTm5]|nr:hypothetical protein NEIG_00117 [Nematocida sp. ERTm5]